MKFMLSLLALGYVAFAASAPSLPVHPGGIGGIFKGPNSETIIKGPDGSVITSAAEGGEVNSHLEPIVVAEPEVVQEVAPIPVIETVAFPALEVESKQSSDLVGPSGRISTHGSSSVVAGPASTTVTGPAVVAETIVKGPPIIGAPLVVTGSADHVALPVSVTPAPIIGSTADLAPISVTASPLSIVTPVITSPALRSALVPSVGVAAPQAIATVSTSFHHSVASAVSTNGGSATAAVAPHGVSASAEIGGVSVVTPSPLPAVSSTVLPSIEISDGVGHGLAGINDRIDLRGALVGDQIAVDNARVHVPSLNLLPPEIVVTSRTLTGRVGLLVPTPGLVTPANVLPNEVNLHSGIPIDNVHPGIIGQIPEVTPSPVIPVTTEIPIGEIRPTSGVIAPSVNVISSEAVTPSIPVDDVRPGNVVPIPEGTPLPVPTDGIRPTPGGVVSTPGLVPSVSVIPPGTSITPRIPVGGRRLIPGTLLTTPGLGAVANSNNIQREEDISSNIPQTPPQINPDFSLTAQDIGLQNPQTLLNSQVQYAGSADLSKTNRAQEIGSPLFRPTSDSVISLTNVQQQNLLARELAKSGIDASQLQLTNVPLSSVSSLPTGLSNNLGLKAGVFNDGLAADAWRRYGRDLKNEKKEQKKKE